MVPSFPVSKAPLELDARLTMRPTLLGVGLFSASSSATVKPNGTPACSPRGGRWDRNAEMGHNAQGSHDLLA